MYAVLSVLLLWAGAVAWSSHQIGDVLDGERAGARWGESTGAGESLWGGGGARRALLAVQTAHHTGRDRQRPPAGRNPKPPPLATGRVNATARKARKTQAAHDKWRAFFTSQFCQLPVVKYNTADHEYLDRPVVGAPPTQPHAAVYVHVQPAGVSHASLHHSFRRVLVAERETTPWTHYDDRSAFAFTCGMGMSPAAPPPPRPKGWVGRRLLGKAATRVKAIQSTKRRAAATNITYNITANTSIALTVPHRNLTKGSVRVAAHTPPMSCLMSCPRLQV